MSLVCWAHTWTASSQLGERGVEDDVRDKEERASRRALLLKDGTPTPQGSLSGLDPASPAWNRSGELSVALAGHLLSALGFLHSDLQAQMPGT